jgi:hypothetical protein
MEGDSQSTFLLAFCFWNQFNTCEVFIFVHANCVKSSHLCTQCKCKCKCKICEVFHICARKYMLLIPYVMLLVAPHYPLTNVSFAITHKHTRMHKHTHTHARMHTRTPTHAHTHAHMRTHTHARAQEGVSALRQGANDYVVLPVLPTELEARINMQVRPVWHCVPAALQSCWHRHRDACIACTPTQLVLVVCWLENCCSTL